MSKVCLKSTLKTCKDYGAAYIKALALRVDKKPVESLK